MKKRGIHLTKCTLTLGQAKKEYRIVLSPCYSEKQHTYLKLGSLKDIAEVVLRDDLENGIVGERIFDEHSFDKAADEAIRNNI